MEARLRPHALVQKLTALPAENLEGREALTWQMLGHMGTNAYRENGFQCGFGCHISVDDNFFCKFNCVIMKRYKNKESDQDENCHRRADAAYGSNRHP